MTLCKHTPIFAPTCAHTHTYIHTHTGPGWLTHANGTLSSPFPPCIIVLPRFSQHKKDDDKWLSQPFYSEPGGYKLRLCVCANGYGTGKGSHISMSVYLMKGENDDRLQWPFKHDVTFGILNWKRDANHVIKTAYFINATEMCKGRVTSGQTAESGQGWPQFLSHYSLSDGAIKNTQYLYQDCLCLQVLKVEPSK